MSPELKAAVLRMYDKQKEAKQKQAEQGKHDPELPGRHDSRQSWRPIFELKS